MDENTFKTAVAAISSGEFSPDDVKTTKKWLETLKSKETALKRKIEQQKNEFVKNKGKTTSKLKEIRGEIKTLKILLKEKGCQ